MTMILRNDLNGLIPTEVSNEIIKDVVRGSAVMNLAEATPMTTEKKQFPVFLGGAGAYWVGEGQRIKTAKAQWTTIEMQAKKLGIIIPIPKESLNDSKIDVFNEIKPKIAEEFAKKFDQAALFGIDSPFTTNIFDGAVTEGNQFIRESVAGQALAGDISDVMALVEDNDEEVNAFATHLGIKNTFRKLVDDNGVPLYTSGLKDGEVDLLYSMPLEFVHKSVFDKTKAELIAGNWNKAYYGVLQGIDYSISTDATLQDVLDGDGKPLSAFEQDLAMLKATMRIAFLVVKPSAFAVLKPKTV